MKKLKRLQILIAFFVGVFFAGSLTAAQGEFLPVQKGTDGAPLGYYEYLPQGYDDNQAANYPVLFFWHGYGESGNGTTELYKLQKLGVPKMLSNGTHFPAVVISAQTESWTDITNLHIFVQYILTNKTRPYRIDTNTMYMTGVSMGGSYTWNYAKKYPTELKAIVTVCGAAGTSPGDLSAMSGVKVRAYHNLIDSTVPVSHTYAWVQAMKDAGAKPVMTLYAYNSHDAWTEAYADPALWNWLWAQPSANDAPLVDAGSTIIHINQSNSVVSLSGAASDDGQPLALKTSWKRRAGPSKITFGNSNSVVTTMNVETTNRAIVTNRIRLLAEDGQFQNLDEFFLIYTYTPTADATAPMVSASRDSLTTNESFGVTLTTTENNGYYSINGGAYTSFTTSGVNLTINGTTTLRYYGRDAAGNNSPTNEKVYTFDTTAPEVTASHYNRTTNQAFTVNLYTTENNGYYSLNGGAYVAFSAPSTSVPINATTTLLYYGRDSLGNTSATNQRIYTFETTAPVVTASHYHRTTNQAFTVNLYTTENNGYYSLNGGPFIAFSAPSTSVPISATTTLLYFGRDSLGNTSVTNQRNYTFDTTAPVVSASIPSLTTNQSFVVQLAASENNGYFSTNGSSFVAYGTAGTNLTISQTTSLLLFGRDILGNTSGTNTFTYTLVAGPDLVMVYENAESGLTNGWVIYDNDPSGATVVNAWDSQKNSRVIQVTGSGMINGYRRYLATGNAAWRDQTRPVVKWSMKYSENFMVYLDVVTSAGAKFITYDASTNEKWLGTNSSGVTNYVFHGLGPSAKNGTWQTFTRDLGADLADLLPGETLLEVNSFLIRGSGSLDDISLQERSAQAGLKARPLSEGEIPVVYVAEAGGVQSNYPSDPTPLQKTIAVEKLAAQVDAAEGCVILTFDLKRSAGVGAGLRFAWSQAGQKNFQEIPVHDLAGVTTIGSEVLSNSSHAIKWFAAKGVDRSKPVNVRVTGMLEGGPESSALAEGIDFSKLFGLQSSLEKVAAVNSPWRGETEGIGFVNLTENARVDIYSVSGRLLTTLPAQPGELAGRRVWNVKDKNGQPVSPGVYNGVITSGSERRSVKIMVLL